MPGRVDESGAANSSAKLARVVKKVPPMLVFNSLAKEEVVGIRAGLAGGNLVGAAAKQTASVPVSYM